MTEAAAQLGVTPEQVQERLELLRLSRALVARQAAAQPRARARLSAAGGVGFALFLSAGIAWAAAGTCPNGLPYCFSADQPAIASQVNHNFAQLKEWLETKTGSVDGGVAGSGTINTGSVSATSTLAAPTISATGSVSAGVSISAPTVSATGKLSGGSLDVPGTWVPLARDLVTTSPREIALTVPSGYRYLKLVYTVATTRTDDRTLFIRFNGDSAANYNMQARDVWASTLTSVNSATQASLGIGCRNVAPQITWTLGDVTIQNVAGQTHQLAGQYACHNPTVVLSAGLVVSQWTNTGEISSLRVFSDPAGGVSANLAVGSEVVLMGLR